MHRLIARCFNQLFARSEHCVLLGGATEPFYFAARAPHRSVLRYREDFAASALHEAAHWCIAGRARRAQHDFGYWYAPPPRSPSAQARFLEVEAKAQALERRFSWAAGIDFEPSLDDVEGLTRGAMESFAQRIELAHQRWCERGLPDRASAFERSLKAL